MIGEVVFIRDAWYLQVNEKGTLEKLPPLKWYQTLWFYVKSRFSKVDIKEIRIASGKNNEKK